MAERDDWSVPADFWGMFDTDVAVASGRDATAMRFPVRVLEISKEDIKSGNIDQIRGLFDGANTEFRANGFVWPTKVLISGYGKDARALWEIPEVRAWCRAVFTEFPAFPYFADRETLAWYTSCLLDSTEQHQELEEAFMVAIAQFLDGFSLPWELIGFNLAAISARISDVTPIFAPVPVE